MEDQRLLASFTGPLTQARPVHQIEVNPDSADRGGEIGDVPAPHLIRACRTQSRYWARLLWWPCPTAAMGLSIGVQHPVEAALRIDIQAPIRQDRHDLPGGGRAANSFSLQVSRIRWRSSSLRRWATWRWLPLRQSTPSSSPANWRRQRCRVVSPTPSRRANSRAQAPVATALPRISSARRQSTAAVNPPLSLPRRPGSFLRQSAVPPPPPGPHAPS